MFVSLKDEEDKGVVKKGEAHCEKVDIKTPGTVRKFSVPFKKDHLLEYVASTSIW